MLQVKNYSKAKVGPVLNLGCPDFQRRALEKVGCGVAGEWRTQTSRAMTEKAGHQQGQAFSLFPSNAGHQYWENDGIYITTTHSLSSLVSETHLAEMEIKHRLSSNPVMVHIPCASSDAKKHRDLRRITYTLHSQLKLTHSTKQNIRKQDFCFKSLCKALDSIYLLPGLTTWQDWWLWSTSNKNQKDIQSSHSRGAFGRFRADKLHAQILRKKSQTSSFLRFNLCYLRHVSMLVNLGHDQSSRRQDVLLSVDCATFF